MKCLICYKPLNNHEKDYHEKCLKKEFELKHIPIIDIDDNKLKESAKKLIKANIAITGVQPKLSLWLEKNKKDLRFTIIDSKSNFIIKPQNIKYQSLPENEDLCMHLASELGIKTAKHSLIRLSSNKLAYITQRFDRVKDKKLACEDLCQLSELLSEHDNKYRGSYEKAGKIIRKYSTLSGFDTLTFFEQILFSFIIGNSDLHLKNLSLLEDINGGFSLSPAYDLLSTALVIKNEKEQLCLNINGKKNRIKIDDFNVLAESLLINEKQRKNVYQRFINKENKIIWWIKNSFLPENQKEEFQNLVEKRIRILENN